MTPIGETLRRERLQRKLSFSDVTRQTRISPRMLEAIEANQFDRLPGKLYADSFIRQYARTLGLDDAEIVAVFRQQCTEDQAASVEGASLRPPAHARTKWAPRDDLRLWLQRYSRLGLLVWLLVTLAAGAYVYRMEVKDERHTTSVSMVATPKEVAPKAIAPEVTPAEVKQVLNVPKSAPAQPILVAFKASEPVWLSVESDGAPAYTGTLENEQTREFDASSKMTVVVGNAGGIAVSLNGKPVGRIGDHGEVRVLQLTAEGVHVAARRPVDPPWTTEDAH